MTIDQIAQQAGAGAETIIDAIDHLAQTSQAATFNSIAFMSIALAIALVLASIVLGRMFLNNANAGVAALSRIMNSQTEDRDEDRQQFTSAIDGMGATLAAAVDRLGELMKDSMKRVGDHMTLVADTVQNTSDDTQKRLVTLNGHMMQMSAGLEQITAGIRRLEETSSGNLAQAKVVTQILNSVTELSSEVRQMREELRGLAREPDNIISMPPPSDAALTLKRSAPAPQLADVTPKTTPRPAPDTPKSDG